MKAISADLAPDPRRDPDKMSHPFLSKKEGRIEMHPDTQKNRLSSIVTKAFIYKKESKIMTLKKPNTKSKKGAGTVKVAKTSRKANQVCTSEEIRQAVTDAIQTTRLRNAILHQYTTIKNYCDEFGYDQAELSRLLNKKCPISLYVLMKHCKNVGIVITVTLTKG